MKKRSSNRERIDYVLDLVASGVEDSSAVVVAEAIRRTSLRQRLDNRQHLSDDRIEFGWNFHSISRSEQTCVLEKIKGIDVVIQ